MAVLTLIPVIRIRLALFALALSTCALSQTGQSGSPAIPEQAANSDIVDTIPHIVGPVPASAPAHRERFGEFVMSTVGPDPLLGEAAGAAIEQWMNTPKEWGQGWGAFGKRFGSNLAYNGIRQTITYGGSLVLDEDTRYFASRQSGVWPRTRHALVSPFTARHSDGRDSFSFSNTAGVIGASAISSAWGP